MTSQPGLRTIAIHTLSNISQSKGNWYMTKKTRQKLKISWEQKELLRWNKKAFFIILKGLSVAKNCLRPESVPLKIKNCF